MPCLNTLSGMLKKKDFISQEHEDPAPIAIFVDMGFGVEHLGFDCLFPIVPSLYLRDSSLIAIASVLGYHLKQAS